MIGLTYIRNLFEYSMQEIADKLKVSKQTISKWENSKIPIAKERLEKLSIIFKIPEKYFQNELTEIEKLKIQKIKLENESQDIGYEYAAHQIDYEIKERKLLTRIKGTLNDCFNNGVDKMDGGLYDASRILEIFSTFQDIVSNKNTNRDIILKILNGMRSIYLDYNTEDEFSIDIANRIREYDEEIKLNQKYMNTQDNENLFGE